MGLLHADFILGLTGSPRGATRSACAGACRGHGGQQDEAGLGHQTPVKHSSGPADATRRALRRLAAARSGETASPRRVPSRSPGPGRSLRRAGEDAGVSPESMEHGEAGMEAAKAHLASPICRACGKRSFARTAHRPLHHDVLSVAASSLCVLHGFGRERRSRQAGSARSSLCSHDFFYSCTLPPAGARESRRLVPAPRRPSSPVPRASVVVWSLRTGARFKTGPSSSAKPARDVTSPPSRKHTPRANPSSFLPGCTSTSADTPIHPP